MRAGYIVLADRYVYTAYARDIVRGSSPTWVRKVYEFAINPDATFYLEYLMILLLKEYPGI